jgi:hypothetical protein
METVRGCFLRFRTVNRACLLLAVLSCFTCGTGAPAWAADDLLDGFDEGLPAADDDLIEGFDGSDTAMAASPQDTTPGVGTDSPVRLGGYLKAAGSYNFAHDPPAAGETDWRGLSRLKSELMLELDLRPADGWRIFAGTEAAYDFAYAINGRDNYTDAVLDDYEGEVELREAFISGRLAKRWDIKSGRQIVVWGTSDHIRVVDVINPLDLREPGLTDIEDLRLPVTLTKLDYYWGPLDLSGMAIHEVRFAKNPPYGSDFYPLDIPAPGEDIPGSNLGNTQLAFSLNGVFPGWDLGVYWVDGYSADTHLEVSPPATQPVVRRKHARVKMVGASTNVALGNWLIKGEAAWFDGLRFTNVPNQTYRRLDAMAGLEYAGFTDTRITVEIADQHLFDHDDRLRQDPDGRNADQFQWVARLDKDFLNDTLTLTLLVSVYGETWQDGAYQRLSAEYEIADAFTVDGGVVLYQSGNLPVFNDVGDNDRLFLEFKYSF